MLTICLSSAKTHFRSPVCDMLAVYVLKSLSVWRMCVSVGPTCHGTHVEIRGQPQVLVCTVHLVGDSLSCSFVVMQASWSMTSGDSLSTIHFAIMTWATTFYMGSRGSNSDPTLLFQALLPMSHFSSVYFTLQKYSGLKNSKRKSGSAGTPECKLLWDPELSATIISL